MRHIVVVARVLLPVMSIRVGFDWMVTIRSVVALVIQATTIRPITAVLLLLSIDVKVKNIACDKLTVVYQR